MLLRDHIHAQNAPLASTVQAALLTPCWTVQLVWCLMVVKQNASLAQLVGNALRPMATTWPSAFLGPIPWPMPLSALTALLGQPAHTLTPITRSHVLLAPTL